MKMGKRKSMQEDDNSIVKYEHFDEYAALRMLEDPKSRRRTKCCCGSFSTIPGMV